jgi:hypothetical protein
MRVSPISCVAFAIVGSLSLHATPLNADSHSAIVDPAFFPEISGADSAEGKKIVVKMDSIIVPKFDFENADISTVVEFLNAKSKELDSDHVGIKFRLEVPAAQAATARSLQREVRMTLTGDTLHDVLRYVCEQTNLSYRIEKGVIILAPQNRIPAHSQ